MLDDVARNCGTELAEYFQRAAERNRKAAWKADEKGEPDCHECHAQRSDEITDALRIFGRAP